MSNPAMVLGDAIREAGLADLFIGTQDSPFVEPPVTEEVFRRLKDYSEAVIVGPPRSGKTILALYISLKMRAEGKSVIYLNFNRVEVPKEDFQAIPFQLDRSAFLIVDNWQSRLECQYELEERTKSKWKDVSILYVSTRFADADVASRSPTLVRSVEEVRGNPIDTERYLHDLAARMVKARVERYCRQNAMVDLEADDQDLEQALAIRTEDKRLRGNLRYLSWRLEEWDPVRSSLRDVGPVKVRERIMQHLIVPAGSYDGDLQKVAVVAQWEEPYQLPPLTNTPAGFLYLQEKNLITQFSGTRAWYMDATDAYLVLEALWGRNWAEHTIQHLTEYLEKSTRQAPIIVSRILSQAEKDTKPGLLVGLLESQVVFKEQEGYLLKRAHAGNPEGHLAMVLLEPPPADETERHKRSSLVRGLYSEALGKLMGVAAQDIALGRILGHLNNLKRHVEPMRLYMKAFLAGLGEDNLQRKLGEEKVLFTTAGVLAAVNAFDPGFGQRIVSEEVGKAVGRAAREGEPNQIVFLFNRLGKDSESSRQFATAFLASFGEDNLVSTLNDRTISGGAQRTFLRAIKAFDPKLEQRLRSVTKLKRTTGHGAGRSPSDRANMAVWLLASGTLMLDERRNGRIQYLNALGQEELRDITGRNRPLGFLQRLLLGALWLAPEEARRIASMVPPFWTELKKKDLDFLDLSRLVNNLRWTNPAAAADVVDLMLNEPDTFDAVLQGKSDESQASLLPRLLVAMENALSGTAERWCEKHLEQLSGMLTSLEDESLNQILVALMAFAPAGLTTVCSSQDMIHRLYVCNDAQLWKRKGILAVIGLPSSPADTPLNSTLVGLSPTDLLLALYGVQTSLGAPSAGTLLEQLAVSDPPKPGVARVLVQIGRRPLPWEATQVIDMVRAGMRDSVDLRTEALERIALAAHLLPELTWNQQWVRETIEAHSQGGDGSFYAPAAFRGLATARFERVLLLQTEEGDPLVRATLNRSHPLAQSVQQKVDMLLEPLTEKGLSLAEWDEALGGRLLASEADRWRYRLLRVGKVRCSLEKSPAGLGAKFYLVREPSEDAIRQLAFGET